ncbi:DUF924 domain-containing protein [Thalassotalea sp. M1531]|uniref:DUF924 domain-containing protein n=1 Tax=Thalassotalea algicola TaxID=2716224 RepID=A0A7Y0LCD2_9GAMM|nr:DUF924 family protein [Thalassotalea algicola]NMP31995.1 DUF924 domain-containing protein [Thalassotalea algicola]
MNNEILTFWFNEISPQQWWQKDDEFDALIKKRFESIHHKAVNGELSHWRESALGSLAEVIVLDQFSRNIYRDKPQSFAFDSLALALAQNAIAKGFNAELDETKRSFLYLPFMHSESLVIHEQAVHLYKALGNAANLEFELKHKAIIEQFGRYPHRNEILGRKSTEAEIEFLKQPNSSF